VKELNLGEVLEMKRITIIALIFLVSLLVFPVKSQRVYIEVEKNITPSKIAVDHLRDSTININIKISVPKEAKMDIVFSVDSSESMKENDPQNLRILSIKNFIDKIKSPNIRIGLISWDHDIDFKVPLTNNFSEVIRKLNYINSKGGTNLNIGLRGAVDLLKLSNRSDAVKIIIFLTDGVGDYTPPTNPSSPVAEAVKENYIIYTVGLGDKIDESILKEIASVTGGRYIHAKDAERLLVIFKELKDEIIKINPPKKVRLIEMLPEYLTLASNFTKEPSYPPSKIDSFTKIEWYIGDMNIGDVWEVRFNVTLNLSNIPIDAYTCEGSRIIYEDYKGNIFEISLPRKSIVIETSKKTEIKELLSEFRKLLSAPMDIIAMTIGGLGAISALTYYIITRRKQGLK